MERYGGMPELSGANPSRDLFLSYNGCDRNTVVSVRQALKRQNITTFYDRNDLTPGQPWFDELEAALCQVRGVAVFIGKEGLGTVQKREMQFALAWQAKEEKANRRFPVVPVLLEGANPETVTGFLALNTWVDLRHGIEVPAALDPFLRTLEREPAAQRQEAAAPICPYRSLHAFREEDAGLFFGREALSQKLLVQVLNHNLVTVIGPSGSGKSSVVLAGLLPLLRRQRPPEETWESILFTPGSKPLHRLAAQLVPLWSQPGRDQTDIGTESEKLGTRLSSGEVSLASFIDLALKNLPNTSRLVAIVDQFEELFTQPLEEERKRFVELLLAASRESKLSVVLTLRADFYGRALELGSLSEYIENGIVNVRGMSREDAKRAIEIPASRTGLEFEAGLIDRILDQVEQKAGALPLLEYALTELWQRRNGRLLTHAAYDAVGGVEGAISKRAEEQFEKLSPILQEIALPVLARLVRVAAANEEGSDTRQPVPLSDFSQDAQTILRLFAERDSRLVVMGRDETGGIETVALAHEALIRSWDRLKRWIDHDREFLLWRQQLRLFQTKWKSLTHHKQAALLQGVYLADAIRWSRERRRDLSAEEIGFIKASQRPKMRSRRWGESAAAIALASAVAIVSWLLWTRRDAYQIQMILATGSDVIRTADAGISGKDWLSALAYSGRSGEAISEGQRIHDPSNRAQSLSGLAAALSKSGRTAEAVAATSDALSAYHLIAITDSSKPIAATEVATALAMVGETQPLLIVARDIADGRLRLRTFQFAAKELAGAGKVVSAVDLVSGNAETVALMGVSRGLAEGGQTGDALSIANRIEEPDLRVYAVAQVSTALAHFGKAEEASMLATEVLKTAKEIKTEPQHSYSLTWAALALAKAGRIGEATEVAQQTSDPDSHDQSINFIAEELARVSKYTDAVALAKQAIKPENGALAFAAVVDQMASNGMGQQAADSVFLLQRQGATLYYRRGVPVALEKVISSLAHKKPQEALAIALQISDPKQRALLVLDAAEELVLVGDTKEVSKPAIEALTWIRTDPDFSERADYLAREMVVLGKAGLRHQFLSAAADALRTASDDNNSRSEDLSGIAQAYAKLHSYREARLIADRCEDSDWKLTAYTTILREYTIQNSPEAAKLWEDQPQYAPPW